MSMKLLVFTLEISITLTSFGATEITVHGSDIIFLRSFAPLTAYTVEKRFVPEGSLLTIAAPRVFIPTDLIDTTSHTAFAVPTHHSYFTIPLSWSSCSSQLDVTYSSEHISVTEALVWFSFNDIEFIASGKEMFKFVWVENERVVGER